MFSLREYETKNCIEYWWDGDISWYNQNAQGNFIRRDKKRMQNFSDETSCKWVLSETEMGIRG